MDGYLGGKQLTSGVWGGGYVCLGRRGEASMLGKGGSFCMIPILWEA